MTDFDADELASPLWAMAMSGADVLDVSEKVKDFDTGLGGIWRGLDCSQGGVVRKPVATWTSGPLGCKCHRR